MAWDKSYQLLFVKISWWGSILISGYLVHRTVKAKVPHAMYTPAHAHIDANTSPITTGTHHCHFLKALRSLAVLSVDWTSNSWLRVRKTGIGGTCCLLLSTSRMNSIILFFRSLCGYISPTAHLPFSWTGFSRCANFKTESGIPSKRWGSLQYGFVIPTYPVFTVSFYVEYCLTV